MLALPGVGVRDAEADEASAAVELLEPGSDGEAEIGVGGVEVGELVDAVVGEEDGADELVGHQTAEYLDPHGRPPQRSIDDANRNRRRGGGDASLGGENAEAVQIGRAHV